MDASAHGIAIIVLEQHISLARSRLFAPCSRCDDLICRFRSDHIPCTGKTLAPLPGLLIPLHCPAGLLNEVVGQLGMVPTLVQRLDRDIPDSALQRFLPDLAQHIHPDRRQNDVMVHIGHPLGFCTGHIFPRDSLRSAHLSQTAQKLGFVLLRLVKRGLLIIVVQYDMVITSAKVGIEQPAQLLFRLALIHSGLSLRGLVPVFLPVATLSVYPCGIHFLSLGHQTSCDYSLYVHGRSPSLSPLVVVA